MRSITATSTPATSATTATGNVRRWLQSRKSLVKKVMKALVRRSAKDVPRGRELGQLLDSGRKPVLFDEKLMSAACDALESATVGGGPSAEGEHGGRRRRDGPGR
eukprot:10602510-Heterocapsa_arctica.AAC.1